MDLSKVGGRLVTVAEQISHTEFPGSPAAWAQRRFWGATVTKGSWFAILQKAGMKGFSIRHIMGVIGGAIGGLFGKLFH